MAIKLSLFIKKPYRREDKKINRGYYLVKKNISAWNLTNMNMEYIMIIGRQALLLYGGGQKQKIP
jgi:hypothetical protein